MNCPFCTRPLIGSDYLYGATSDPDHKIRIFSCQEHSCWVFGEFPRYLSAVNGDRMTHQEYALDNKFYVKVFENYSLIYQMVSFMLVGEIKIPRAIWLNMTNIPATLDKIKTIITFS